MIDNSYLSKKDSILLNKLVKEIKRLPNLSCILQMGSSTYSKDYRDIDLIVFFDKVLPPMELVEINEKYSKYKFYVEGVYIKDHEIDRGVKIFIKFLSNQKTKKILYGKYPYQNIKVKVEKLDVAYYLRYTYNFALSQQNFESTLSASLNAMLTYKNIFPKNKDETLILFKKHFPNLDKYLPENAEYYLRNTNEKNFRNLYSFFQKSMEFFMK